jgi:hypothetical protein
VRPAPGGSPAAQLAGALDAWLEWIAANRTAYAKLMRSATAHREVGDLVDGVRNATAGLIVAALAQDAPAPPALRTAVRGWLWFVDGACLDWLEHADLDREELRDLLAGTLAGAVEAAGEPAVAATLRAA